MPGIGWVIDTGLIVALIRVGGWAWLTSVPPGAGRAVDWVQEEASKPGVS